MSCRYAVGNDRCQYESYTQSIRTTNALENLNREFRRRTKTQASFSSEESAVALLFGLIASGQIQLRRIDGYQRLSEVLEHAEVAA